MSDMSKKADVVSRRSFMRIAGVGAGAAGAAALGVTATAEEAAAVEAGGDKATSYRETDHIRAYYKNSRF